MQTKSVLTLSDANLILDAAQQEAEANGWAVSIAVADDGGHLLALRRLDGAAPMTPTVASEKARSSALGGKETQAFEDMINNGRTAFLSAPLTATLSGGVPVFNDGRVAGTVGVSGVKPDQDVQIARAGIAALS
ncbi:GlcG/HbpS family heme-binding protein [Onishia niordana]|uniref:GlcG/HbpS family heme-binding protein n=1 Tax=Onishia niordana TaxID=2508711 RepID=UPI0010A02AE8|nr:heme-binding protein [Halomonas niordiana]